MTDKDLKNQLEGLFADIVPEPGAEAGIEAEEAELLLKGTFVDLLGGEARDEPVVAGPMAVEAPLPIPVGQVSIPAEEAPQDARKKHDLPQISPASARFWEVTLGKRRTRMLGILLRGATILGGVLLVLLLIRLTWQKAMIWSGFHILYFAAYIVAIIITLIQWMLNSSLTGDLREAEEMHAEAVRSQTLLEEQADELATANALLQKHTLQLQTAALISQAAASVLDPDELMQQAVSLIRERFDLYYVGLFLIDESEQWVTLQAGTGEAGRQMLAQGYRLEVGDASTVGWCTANAQVRITPSLSPSQAEGMKEGRGTLHGSFVEVHPLLPKTRSEMAMPLQSRGQVIGALDVQSAEREAFSQEDISVLQTVANQVAVAIDNAHLFSETQAKLEEIEARQKRHVREQWADFLSAQAVPSYERTQTGVTPLGDAIMPGGDSETSSSSVETLSRAVGQAMAQQEIVVQSGTGNGAGQTTLVVPINLRGEVLGALGLHEMEDGRQWTDDEITLIETVADQMALAIENARLLEETRRRAERERVITDLSTQIRASTEVDTILRTAIRELGQALRASDGLIQLNIGDEADSPQADDGAVVNERMD